MNPEEQARPVVPTVSQLASSGLALGMELGDADLASFSALAQPYVQAYQTVAGLPDYMPEHHHKFPRSYEWPDPKENQKNAWYVKTRLQGAKQGKLQGKRIALKDNILLAGVPVMNGNAHLEGYLPDVDATVVTRVLEAGASIVGKTHCEDLCISGGSHTNAKGPVHNPYKQGFSSAGSSSGSGVVVALGEADMALGCDQGGSIRLPSAWCGIVGMKPTHGLVPYSGIMPIEVYVDHVGPMTSTVADNAVLLEVLAGVDGLDWRQRHNSPAGSLSYTHDLNKGVAGLRIGVLKEGFGLPNSEVDVDAKVLAAAEQLRALGATVEDVSVPGHLLGGAIWTPIGLEGLLTTMLRGNAFGCSRGDLYVGSLMRKMDGWKQHPEKLSETLKILAVLGDHFQSTYSGEFYGRALNQSRRLAAEYDAVLDHYNVLLMPTTPMKPTALPAADAPREVVVQKAFEMIANTAPFDITHHPALTVPCGMIDGLPVGMQLVGKKYDEAMLYRVGFAFEQSCNWKTL